MEKFRHVEAIVGGTYVRLELRDTDYMVAMTRLEALLGRAPYALFQMFAMGQWSAADVLSVLTHAHPDGPIRGGLSLRRVMAKEPPGRFAALAAKVLEAHLFGLDETDVVFHEAASDEVAA